MMPFVSPPGGETGGDGRRADAEPPRELERQMPADALVDGAVLVSARRRSLALDGPVPDERPSDSDMVCQLQPACRLRPADGRPPRPVVPAVRGTDHVQKEYMKNDRRRSQSYSSVPRRNGSRNEPHN
jgi:hypothetical protein